MMISRGILAVALGLALSGCDNVLDLKDLEAVSQNDVWNDADLAQAYVDRIYYDNLPGWSTGEATQSDEAGPGGTSYLYGQLTESSVNYWPYNEIRRINILLANVDNGTITAALKTKLKGEAYFFRAYRYFELVKRYGGVPLILKPQELTDSLLVERAATSQVISQVVADLDSAIAKLPALTVSSGNIGRLHIGTAMAFKGRVLLFYASPQFNRNGDMDRWQKAYDANLAAKTYLASKGFGLYADFEKLWFVPMNSEAILVRRYAYSPSGEQRTTYGYETGGFHRWAAATRPLDESQGSTDGNRPTLEMVNAFPMKDGRPIANSPAYDAVYFWKNRDPRFKATIAYNGAVWELSAKSGRRQWTYTGGESNNPTKTGFYCRKAVNPTHSSLDAYNGTTPWIELRFAEVLMNLAEAANGIGNTQEAYDQIIALRKRAGIEAGNGGLYGLDAGMGRTQMQAAIMLERRIEFAFEAHRYWDLRRNMLFESQLNGTRRHGVKIALKVPTATWLPVRDTVSLDSRYAEFFTTTIVNLDTQQTINWKSNYYFFAIPPGELQTNSKLAQTLGWAGGTFDPLQ